MDSEGTGRTLAAQHAHRILGEAGCSQFPEDAPADWVGVQRGRDLFVPGWGGFDIAAALDASGGASASIPSVSELRSIGYLMKYFPDLQDQMIRHKIQQLLRTPETLLARYIVQHHVFWADARNGNRLDEVESHWQDTNVANPSRALKEEPKKLLNRLVRDRAIASHPLIEFAHLVGQPTVFFDVSFFASTLESSFELSVLEESHSVLRAAQELNNCAADYSRNVRQKRCALVVLRSRKKLLAMGEWDLHDRRWCQISEHSDEPVRDEWLKMYKQLETDDFFPIRAVLPLPDLETSTGLLQEVKEDVVSIFSVEGPTSLDRLCSASILGIEPCMGWPCLLDGLEAFHPEASSALLLWSLAAAASSVHSADCELEIVIEKLLCKRADPDTMTDRGWSSLMFAVMVPDPSAIVARLLKAAADVDARAAQSGRTALMLACSIQNFSLVCRLVTFAASLDVAARIDGRTAVIQAVEVGAWSIAEFLLEANADINALRFDGKTSLMLAVEANQVEFVRTIVHQKAELNTKDERGSTALSIALEMKRSSQMDFLHILANGHCDLNMICPASKLPAVTLAASAGNMEVVELLVRCRAGIHGEHSSVAAAAASEKWHMVKRLVELEADPNVAISYKSESMKTNGYGNPKPSTVLIQATKSGDESLVQFLCHKGASANFMSDSNESACGAAAAANHLGVLKILAEAHADLDRSPLHGLPPLLVAANSKRWAALHLLLELRADTEVCNPDGETALIIAASQGNARGVSKLIDCRAKLEARSKGQTALLAAARQQSWMVVRRLAEARADLDAIESPDAKPVIVRLAETSQWDTLIHLARHGANLEAKGLAGRTVLMYAAESGLDDVAWWLLQCRADPNAEDQRGETALLKACNRQLESFMRLLWENGARIEIPLQKSRIPAMSKLLRKWQGNTDD